MIRFAREGRAQAARALAARILERHRDLARRAAPGSAGRVVAAVDGWRDPLENLVDSAACSSAATDELQERLQTIGSNLSSSVFAAALRETGIRASVAESSAHNGIDQEIRPMLKQGVVPVVSGGAAAMLSAAMVSAAIDARELQVWTDADGVPAADPAVVPSAHAVPRLSFAEALELARWGVKALHAGSVELATAREMPIVIRNSRRPDRPGTVIDGQAAAATAAPAALAWRRGAVALQFSSPESRAPAFVRRIFDVCGQSGEPSFAAAIAGPSVVVVFEDRARADCAATRARQFARVTPLEDVALLSAVGESLATQPRVAAGVLEAVQDVTVHASVHHPSGRSLTMLMDDADAGEAMRRVYDRFFAQVCES